MILSSSTKAVYLQFVLDTVPAPSPEDPVVAIEPFLMALRQERYTFIKALHIWDVPLTHQDMASIVCEF